MEIVSPAAADWISGSDLPWTRLVTFGPAAFETYARLRLLPDPVRPGQSENDVDAEDWRAGQWPLLFSLLASGTTTPDECYFCFWEGFVPTGSIADGVYGVVDPHARPGQAPAPPHRPPDQVVVPHRSYWLFRGPLAEAGTTEWAFVWPADRAWCVTKDVDPHWAGIGGPARLIDELVADERLDVVVADPTQPPPAYR